MANSERSEMVKFYKECRDDERQDYTYGRSIRQVLSFRMLEMDDEELANHPEYGNLCCREGDGFECPYVEADISCVECRIEWLNEVEPRRCIFSGGRDNRSICIHDLECSTSHWEVTLEGDVCDKFCPVEVSENDE